MATAIIGNSIHKLKASIVTELPDKGVSNKIYYIPNNTTSNNRYDEYVWLKDVEHPNGYFEKIGQKDINLEPYALKEWVNSELKPLKEDITNLNKSSSYNYIGILSSWNDIYKNLTTDSTEADILNYLYITPLKGNKTTTKEALFSILDECAINKKFLKESSTNAYVFVEFIGSCYVIQIVGNRAILSNGNMAGSPVIRNIAISASQDTDLKVHRNPFEIRLETITTLETKVDNIQEKLNTEDYLLDLLSYGVSWKPNVADPVLTRVGNSLFHKNLPIQNNMKGCIAQMKGDNKQIIYYLNPTDWRWRADTRGYILENQTLNISDDIYTLTNDIFSTLQYENQWVKINKIPCKVSSIDITTKTAILQPESTIAAGTYNVELGAVLNGYDGEVMVEVPEFWIKSWDTDTRREVRISPSKINDTWEHQPRLLVAAYHDTLLNTVPTDMGYLSNLEKNSAISVMNTNSYCRGGSNSSTYDAYITTDKFRSMLGKPITSISRAIMRAAARRAGKEILSYLQYKRVLYWLYFIEYANFNCQATFNSALTSEGYRQGGLGSGVTTVNGTYWNYYNGYNPLTPNGYTNEFGNGTNIKAMTIVMPTTSGGDPASSTTQYVPRWHGIENPFGDIWTNVDGIIINSSSIVENGKNYSEVYATDDPTLYSNSDYKSMKRIGIELNENGYVKEWDLGNTAEIIPRLNGGNTTQYKCDYHWINISKELKTLILGSNASDSSMAGLGFFGSSSNVNAINTNIGFRSSCVVV